jgi:hypothetical protein
MDTEKPTYSLAIQAKDTGRFLMARRIGNKHWGFAATCVGGSMPLNFLAEMVKLNTGREMTSIMSFEHNSRSSIAIYHQWFDAEGEITPLEGQELGWFSLFDFPKHLSRPVLQAMRDKIFREHIVQPYGIYA